MQIISFNDWCEQEVSACREGIKTDCPYCDGYGESECDCCGQDTTCTECEGEGSMIIDNPSDLIKSKSAKQQYKKQIILDLKKFSRYVGNDFIFYKNQWVCAKYH